MACKCALILYWIGIVLFSFLSLSLSLSLHILSFFLVLCLIYVILTCFFYQDKLLSIAFEQTLVEVNFILFMLLSSCFVCSCLASLML